MEEIKELSKALLRVSEELELARKVYRAMPFLFWAAVLPFLYLASVIASPMENNFVSGFVSATAILWFIIEEKRAWKKIASLERVLGREVKTPKLYMLSQIAGWIIAGVVASSVSPIFKASPEAAWMLVLTGLGVLGIVTSDAVFTGKSDLEMLIAGLVPLSGLYWLNRIPINPIAFAIIVIASSFAFTAFLYVRKALR